MLKLLTAIGERSAIVLLAGLLLAMLLPSISSALRPALPLLVSLVLGLSIARLDIAATSAEIIQPRQSLILLALILLLMPISCWLLVWLWHLLGFSQQFVFLLIVFAAAPPISSATSLSLLLGYDARITLQVTLLTTLILPILGPLCFAMLGVSVDVPALSMALRIASMIAGGFIIGIGLQYLLGKTTIAQHPQAFNGAAVIAMLLFLFPLFDGVLESIHHAPLQALAVLCLALLLNLGSHLLVRHISQHFTDTPTAQALGLVFGNRNVSFYLAALPFNPLLSVFVAAAQIPIYATPALFAKNKIR